MQTQVTLGLDKSPELVGMWNLTLAFHLGCLRTVVANHYLHFLFWLQAFHIISLKLMLHKQKVIGVIGLY